MGCEFFKDKEGLALSLQVEDLFPRWPASCSVSHVRRTLSTKDGLQTQVRQDLGYGKRLQGSRGRTEHKSSDRQEALGCLLKVRASWVRPWH